MEAFIIDHERLEKIAKISLKEGAHEPDSTFCVMEAVAFVAQEPWTDHPQCACPVISTFLRSWNDSLSTDEDRDRLLKPLIPFLIGTRNKYLEEKRSLMATDWLVRIYIPTWLRLAELKTQADSLANLPEITAIDLVPSIRAPIEAVRKDTEDTARDTARDTAWDPDRAAAWDAAWAAAGAAAWAAARDPAWDPVRDAAWAAAWAATWAAARVIGSGNITTTVLELQESALQLVKRMIDAK